MPGRQKMPCKNDKAIQYSTIKVRLYPDAAQAELFEKTTALCKNAKKAANWLIGDVSRLMKERGIGPEDLVLSPGHLAKLITLTGAGRINLNTAREVLEAVFDGDRDPEAYVKEHGLLMVNDDEALEKAVEAALKANPKTVEEYRAGKTKVMGFLVGQVMKGMKGKANPAKVNEILAERLKG